MVNLRAMKRHEFSIMIIALAACSSQALGQGFVNLDFEQAVIVPDPSNGQTAVYASNAMPGWTLSGVYLGPNDILYNDLSLGAPSISIFSTNGIYPVIDGAFSVDLYGGAGFPAGVSMAQSALVPVGTESLRFKAISGGGAQLGSLVVSLGGENTPLSILSSGAGYTLYGSDISSFGGLGEPLVFSVLPGGNNYWEIDDIQFSPMPIPEPQVLGLGALCVLCASARVRFQIMAGNRAEAARAAQRKS